MRIATRLSYYTGLLAFVAANSFAQCYDVAGVIKLTPVPYQEEELDFFGCAFSFPEGLNSDFCITSEPDPSAYFDIRGSGNVSFKGTSELTAVPVVSEAEPESTFAITPLIYPPIPFGVALNASRLDLQSFTTQAILEAKFRGLRGTLYTKDTGVITQIRTPAGGFSGQIVKIVGGDGDFDGVTGLIGVAGQEIGGVPGSAATYTGTFCLPDD